MKLSKNAAIKKTGTNPNTIFSPSRPPFNIEARWVAVLLKIYWEETEQLTVLLWM
jgi:hypothetical protein